MAVQPSTDLLQFSSDDNTQPASYRLYRPNSFLFFSFIFLYTITWLVHQVKNGIKAKDDRLHYRQPGFSVGFPPYKGSTVSALGPQSKARQGRKGFPVSVGLSEKKNCTLRAWGCRAPMATSLSRIVPLVCGLDAAPATLSPEPIPDLKPAPLVHGRWLQLWTYSSHS